MTDETFLSQAERRQFAGDGFFIRRALFSPDEAAAMLAAAQADPLLKEHMFDRRDNDGLATRAVQWNHPGDSTYGIGARSRRVVEPIEALMGGEVYHWHSKVTAKDAGVGGAWEWHQDYGYWYLTGCPYPDMMSVMVALDPSVEANGCLKVMRGSHKFGRLDHVRDKSGQAKADPERIAWAETRHETVVCELQPGDGLFFHSNLLHSSGPNLSDKRRWLLIYCYNRANNEPFIKTHNPMYSPLVKTDDLKIDIKALRFGDGSESFQSDYVKKQIAAAE
jgi:ectoine hydroxylase-related dioxygenase (phytanoyl-CoA dioxygenase family)